MKILHYIYGLKLGGAESFLYNLCSSIAKNNTANFTFHFAIQSSDITNNRLKALIENNNWEIHILPFFLTNPLSHYWKLNDLIRKEKYAVVHVHMNAIINPFPLICSHRNNTKLIIHSHNSSSNIGSPVGKLIHIINKNIFIKNNDCLIACSDKAGAWMFTNRNFLLVPNAIDLSKFLFSEYNRKEVRQNYGIRDNEILIGSVARFVKAKNHKGMVDIFADYLLSNPNAKMILIGDGPLLGPVKAYVKQKQLVNNVIFTGATQSPSKFYSAMDIFLMPSLFEGLAFTAIEAQASGLPCIVSENASRDIDPLQTVRFVSLKSPVSYWSRAIIKELKIAVNRNRKDFGVKLSDTNFNIDYLTKTMKEIYLR